MSVPTDPVQLVLSRASGVKNDGDGYVALCPAHDDTHPSLAITRGTDGRCLLYCRAGCNTKDVLQKLELNLSDLMARDSPPHTLIHASQNAVRYATAKEGVDAYCKQLGKYANKWVYKDAQGAPVGIVLRWNLADKKKTIRALWWLDHSWSMSPAADSRPLFQLDLLGSSRRVFVAEGEKCAQILAELGCTATTSSGGGLAAKKSDWSPLAGREVFLLPDEDAAGTKYIDAVRSLCEALTPPARVCVLHLHELKPESGEDVVEWIRDHFAGDGAKAREELVRRADEAAKALEEEAETLAGSVSLATLLSASDALEPPQTIPSDCESFDAAQPFGAVEETAKVLWGGEPGSGKTRWMLDLAIGYASKGARVVYLLGEMSPKQMLRRALLRRAGLGNAALLAPLPAHTARLHEAQAWLAGFAEQLRFMQPPLTFDTLARAAAWADVVFVDPLQAVRAESGFDARHEELDAFMHRVVDLAERHRTAFHLTSEIGKQDSHAERTLHTAFKGSSALAQYADAAYLLKKEIGGLQEAVCLKQREGECKNFTFRVGLEGYATPLPPLEGGNS